MSPAYQEVSAVRFWHHSMLRCHLLQIGPTVGKGEYRVQAADALVAAVRSSAAAFPELVEMILQASPVLPLHLVSACWQHLQLQWKLPACFMSETPLALPYGYTFVHYRDVPLPKRSARGGLLDTHHLT